MVLVRPYTVKMKIDSEIVSLQLSDILYALLLFPVTIGKHSWYKTDWLGCKSVDPTFKVMELCSYCSKNTL